MQTSYPTLPRTSPEEQGISSAAIREFIEVADRDVNKIDSLMILRHGSVVTEVWWPPHTATTPHIMHSLSKSFTSTAIGLAAAEGKLNINDDVLSYFPEDAPTEPSANLKAMRIRDLLTMSTGQESEPHHAKSDGIPWTKFFLSHPVPYEPGTHFLYNSAATYMLSAIIQKVSGQTLLDYLGPRLFEPLGIMNASWGTSPQGITLGGWGLWVCTGDIANFGQMLLQKGLWNGKQIVPAAWIEEATSKQVSNGTEPDNDWHQGYGYQFWQCRHGAIRGDGMDGQFCILMPEQDTVVAITSETKDMGAELALVWKYLLPAMQHGTLPDNPQELANLKETISQISAR